MMLDLPNNLDGYKYAYNGRNWMYIKN